MKFYCVADEETVRGFRLAGVKAHAVETAEQARVAINDFRVRPDCGIIIITETVAEMIRPQVEMIRQEREGPLIVEVPGPDGPMSGRKSLRELVEEAVGISVG